MKTVKQKGRHRIDKSKIKRVLKEVMGKQGNA